MYAASQSQRPLSLSGPPLLPPAPCPNPPPLVRLPSSTGSGSRGAIPPRSPTGCRDGGRAAEPPATGDSPPIHQKPAVPSDRAARSARDRERSALQLGGVRWTGVTFCREIGGDACASGLRGQRPGLRPRGGPRRRVHPRRDVRRSVRHRRLLRGALRFRRGRAPEGGRRSGRRRTPVRGVRAAAEAPSRGPRSDRTTARGGNAAPRRCRSAGAGRRATQPGFPAGSGRG